MASAKKKKKNIITLASLAAVLVVLLAVYLGLSKWKGSQEQEEEPEESIVLAKIEEGSLSSLAVATDSYQFQLIKEESGWALEGDAEFPLNAARAETMETALVEFAATRKVLENASDLEEYGLTAPALTVTAVQANGEETVLRIGDRSSADGGYYACVGENNDVYLISASDRGKFYLSEIDLVQADAVPAFDANYVTGLKVSGDSYPEFTIAASPEEDERLIGTLFYPCSLYDVYPLPVHIDQTSFVEMMGNYQNISLGELVSYHASELGNYGLSSPKTALSVWYTDSAGEEDGVFTLYAGNQTEDGTGLYVRLSDSNQVFRMDLETADALFRVDATSLISKFTQLVNMMVISAVNIDYDGTSRVFAIDRVSEAGEDGTETTTDYFIVDGKKLNLEEESDAFKDIYQILISLHMTGGLDLEASLGEEPVLTLEFFEKDTNESLRRIRYLPIDGEEDSYAIEINGVPAFTADVNEVEEAIAALKAYQP